MSEESKKRKLQELEETCTSFRKSHFLRKHIRIDKILELMKILAAKDCNQVVESDKVLSALFDSFATGNIMEFSALENDDVDSLLHLENKGRLVFEDSVKVVPSQHFLTTLTKLQRRWNMSLKAGRRSLIDSYILEAVEFDLDKKEEKTYDETTDRLAVYPEYYVKPVRISDDLQLTGSIDYITANRKEQIVDELAQGTSLVASPTFCTVEAKRDEAFAAGKGEALGQMLALHQKYRSPIHGCLTDGMRWTFYYVDEEGYYQSKMYIAELEQSVVLGILRHWVRGQLPSSN